MGHSCVVRYQESNSPDASSGIVHCAGLWDIKGEALWLVSGDSDHPYVLDQLKQIAFYTDCLGDAHWSIPDEVIDESPAWIRTFNP